MYISPKLQIHSDLVNFLPNTPITIFIAKKIVTMAQDMPEAQAVAVQDDQIVAVGCLDDMQIYFDRNKIDYTIDKTFVDNVIYPGFIEAHMHAQLSGIYNMSHIFLGYFDRSTADGGISKGCQSPEEIIVKLQKVLADNPGKYNDQQWLNAIGIDPLILGDSDLKIINSRWLDRVSKDIPICLNHASGHLMTVNSRAIELSGLESIHDVHVGRYEDGACNGNVAEPEFFAHILKAGGMRIAGDPMELARNATRYVAKYAKNNGCTTITDKAFGFILTPNFETYEQVLSQETLPVRFVVEPFYSPNMQGKFNGWDGLRDLRKKTENKRFIFGNMKMLADGSIQGYTANLLSKTYYNGVQNGKLIFSDEAMYNTLKDCEDHGYAVSIHTNGNGATEQALRVIESLRKQNPTKMFRHTLEHAQLATENQLQRAADNGLGMNFFVNHLYYWGDVHAKYTVGPYEILRMEPLRSAANHNLHFGFHSDDPITEVNPLFSAWCACNRKSGISGTVFGTDQALTVAEAMRCITIEAAWLLHLEDKIGSIEIGKWADFTILAEEATEANKATFKDIKILATVSAGKIQ